MEDKVNMKNINSALRFLQVVTGFLAIFCCLLLGVIFWLVIENQYDHQFRSQLYDEVRTLEDWRTELEAVELPKPLTGEAIPDDLLSEGRQKRQVTPAGATDSLIAQIAGAVEDIRGPAGSPGAPGKDGRDGRDGRDAVCSLSTVDRINITIQEMVDKEVSRVTQLSGTVYTRWGRTVCPSTSNLVMNGISAGSYSDYQGGASEYLCLPENPDLSSTPLPSRYTRISGVEYDHTSFEQDSMLYENAPCSICQTRGRYVQEMFPAKVSCPDRTWTLEYTGFLMTEYYRNFRSEYVCVDGSPEAIEGLSERNSGAHWFHVVSDCHARTDYRTLGACPPYKPDSVLSCVVCSK